jgi:LysM repeat protein
MVLRAVRSRSLGSSIRVVALAAFGIAVALPHSLAAQQPAAPVPATHTVKRGDTLWDIAKLYLGDPFLWPEIYRINSDQIEDPHWIYPGEILKLPGAQAKVIAVAPPAIPTPAPAPAPAPARSAPMSEPAPAPKPLAPAPALVIDTSGLEPAASSVRMGEYVAAPWVDQRGGPRGSGFIMQAADLPGIASANQSRMRLYDNVIVAPPVGAVAPERELYLSYTLGPLIEDFGQIVIPTGVVEITRSARNGEAAVGRVVKMFGEVLQNQRLVALDSSAGVVRGTPMAVINGRAGKVRWIYDQPVLPSLQNYLVLDIPKGAANPGDQVELFKPRQGPGDGRDLAIPELHIAWAQVLRVTPHGATVIITAQEQPKIEDGTAARVAAKIP